MNHATEKNSPAHLVKFQRVESAGLALSLRQKKIRRRKGNNLAAFECFRNTLTLKLQNFY